MTGMSSARKAQVIAKYDDELADVSAVHAARRPPENGRTYPRTEQADPSVAAEIKLNTDQYRRIRRACQSAVPGINLDAYAARISLTVRKLRSQNSLPGGVSSLAPAGSPEPRSEDLPSSAGSDPVPAVSVGNETPVRIRASRASGTPAASPDRHAGGERQDITSNGDRRKASSRASAAVARRDRT